MKEVKIALLGLGVVGGGTYKILTEERETIKERYGVDIVVAKVMERDIEKAKALGIPNSALTTDIEDIAKDKEISVVAEFFGGVDFAKHCLLRCLDEGKSIVTANKEMFAKSWEELERHAKKSGAGLYFEASCVGGVPVIRALCESLQGNKVVALKGIVNGTTNFILSKMYDEGIDYQTCLKEAQQLGYAEADPTADVEGFDSSYKIRILSSLAFGVNLPLNKIYREGITAISTEIIEEAKTLGYTVKLIASGKNNGAEIQAHVYPALIPLSHPLSSVKEAYNALYVTGNNVGDLMFYGKGAGERPTGSALVSDIVKASTDQVKIRFPFIENDTEKVNEDFSAHHLLIVKGKDDFFDIVENSLSNCGISIKEKYLSKQYGENKATYVTREVKESCFNTLLEKLKNFNLTFDTIRIIF